ncbi:MAG: phospholipid carrier-dependent glycosyltransferase [Actinomycetota bacterium]|nr:phospholipid carrier-dependent glycosyltransferase [Actinomycetota bacterium]
MEHRARRVFSASVLLPFSVLVLAAGLRLWALDSPPGPYWDEGWYALDAAAYIGQAHPARYPAPPPTVHIAADQTWVHPPLGKWAIALGEAPLGRTPVGWRLPSALFGIAGVGIVYLIGLALFDSKWWAALSALLLAVDGLHTVQSRMAMLDIFLSTFVSAGVLMIVLERSKRERGYEPSPGKAQRWFGSRYRLWAGLFLGAAVATKWSGTLPLALAIVLSAGGFFGPGSLRHRILESFDALVVVPLGVYVASYSQFWIEHGLAIKSFLVLQWRMLEYGLADPYRHAAQSAPWTWLLLLHPARYLPPTGSPVVPGVHRILALGNPILWWGFLLCLPFLAYSSTHDWRDGVILGFLAFQYLPWLVVGRGEYIWYVLPAVPFMCLGLASTLRRLPPRVRVQVAVGVSTLAVSTAVLFSPVWIGFGVPSRWMDTLRWLPAWH